MVFIQYFQKGLLSNKPIEACGDRAVIVLDGRQSLETWKQDAIDNNGIRRPVYCGYQLFKGDNFNRSQPITEYISLQ